MVCGIHALSRAELPLLSAAARTTLKLSHILHSSDERFCITLATDCMTAYLTEPPLFRAGDDGDLLYGGGETSFGTEEKPFNFTWTPNG